MQAMFKVGNTVWWIRNGNVIDSGKIILARPSEVEMPRQIVLEVGGELVLKQSYELAQLHQSPSAAVAAELQNIMSSVTKAMARARELDAALVKANEEMDAKAKAEAASYCNT